MIAQDYKGNPVLTRKWMRETVEQAVADVFIDHDLADVVRKAVHEELRALLPEIVAAAVVEARR